MSTLSRFLPPLASDYSGACSVLYDLDIAGIVFDAGCCYETYVYYDEPRWETEQKQIVSLTLRRLDVALGNEQAWLGRIASHIACLPHRPSACALVGTPVPALVGSDFQGLARELEHKLAGDPACEQACELAGELDCEPACESVDGVPAEQVIPVYGIETSGFEYYDKGIVRVWKKLFDALVPAVPPASNPQANDPLATGSHATEPGSRTAYLLGVSPFETGSATDATLLARYLLDHGWDSVRILGRDTSLEDLAAVGSSSLNIALSCHGIDLAHELNRRLKTPYRIGYPVLGGTCSTAVRAALDTLAQRNSLVTDTGSQPPILILHDRVIGMSLRAQLLASSCTAPVIVGSFAGLHAEAAQEGDFPVLSEQQLIEHVRELAPACIIADPILKPLLEAALSHPGTDKHTCPLIPFAYPALSGNLSRGSTCVLYNGA